MDEILFEVFAEQQAQTEHLAAAVQTIRDAIPILFIGVGLIVGLLLVKVFSGGMKDAS